MRKMLWQPTALFSSPERRFAVLLQLTSLGLLLGLIITITAWIGIRSYPLSAMISGLSAPPFLHTTIFFLLLVSLFGALSIKKYQPLCVGVSFLLLLFLITLDITRLQPWILHYTGILLIGFCLLLMRNYQASTQRALDAAAILLGGIYFWSGLQKINAAFFLEVFPWFTEHLSSPFGELGQTLFGTLGFFVPFLEIGLALGLFTKRFRNISLIGCGMMLILVLSAIGPFGQSWNSSVWPWNVIIYLSVVALFWKNPDTVQSFLARQKNNSLAALAFLVIWVVPVGNVYGLTDHYLSWSLYSGRVPTAILVGNQEFLVTLSPLAKDGALRFEHWTTSTLNLVPYPQERVFKSIFATLCKTYPEQNLSLEIKTPRFFISTSYNQTTVSCPQ